MIQCLRGGRSLTAALSALLLALAGSQLLGQNPLALTVLSRDGRRTLPITASGGQEFLALDDLANTFQLTVREETGGVTVSYRGRTIALTPDQTIASVSGRMISLPAPLTRSSGRWLVPVDFISRALLPIYDTRLELRRVSRLVIVGDLRVPRVAIQHEVTAAGARLTIESTPRAAASVNQDGTRLTIRFDADAIDLLAPPAPLPGFVAGYRVSDATAITVDLGPRAVTVRAATQVVDASTRLIVELLPPAADTAAPPAAPATTQGGPDPRPIAPDVPVLPLRASGWTIVIDPGHGGEDAGVTGGAGTKEKDIALAVGRRLKSAIESRLGYHVVMTREDDRLIAVADRTALANNNKADLFISLHANASFRPAVAGAAVYVAAFEDSATPAAGHAPVKLPVVGGGFRDIELVPWNLAQIRHKEQSTGFAGLVIDQFRDRIPVAAQAVDAMALRVLESANMPAILIELGYLTNETQEKLLATSDFQGTAAQSIVEAIVHFVGVAGSEEAR